MKIADMVHKAGLTTRVPYRATCASACALVFAAGVSRLAHAELRIAVHSVGVPLQPDVHHKLVENDYTLAGTPNLRGGCPMMAHLRPLLGSWLRRQTTERHFSQ